MKMKWLFLKLRLEAEAKKSKHQVKLFTSIRSRALLFNILKEKQHKYTIFKEKCPYKDELATPKFADVHASEMKFSGALIFV